MVVLSYVPVFVWKCLSPSCVYNDNPVMITQGMNALGIPKQYLYQVTYTHHGNTSNNSITYCMIYWRVGLFFLGGGGCMKIICKYIYFHPYYFISLCFGAISHAWHSLSGSLFFKLVLLLIFLSGVGV